MGKNKKKQLLNMTTAKQGKKEPKLFFDSIIKKINKGLPDEGINHLSSEIALLEKDEEQKIKTEQLFDEINTLLESLTLQTKKYNKLNDNFEEQEEKLASDKEELKKEKDELEAEKEKLTKKEAEVSSTLDQVRKTEKELQKREESLKERESNAIAGFQAEKQKSIIEKTEALDAIDEEVAKTAKNRLDKIRHEQKELDSLKESLDQEKKKLNREKHLLEIRKRSQDDWEQSIQNEIEEKFRIQMDILNTKLNQTKASRKIDQEEIEALHQELIRFEDLKRTLEGAGIEDVQHELSENRRLIKKLQTEIKDAPRYDMKEENDLLQQRVDEQSGQITDLQTELEDAKAELHRTRMSVAAKHHLEQKNRMLELHNKTLESSINSLSTQLDELVAKQQGSKAFPSLCDMDKKHNQEAADIHAVPDLKTFADQIRMGMACVYPDIQLYYHIADIRLFLGGLAMSNLHIIQGISGTGKTSLAKAFAKVVGGHCTDIAVQAGWRDKDDLIGHYNAFEKKFYERETLQALYRAQLPEFEDRINIILLDEMNLSRPEQYFAEFLSAMEKRPEERIIVLVENEQKNAPDLFKEGRKIIIPENVWFIGTANHDETTNEFADKTFDRAHVMELGQKDDKIDTFSYEQTTYSFSSFQEEIQKACKKHEKKVDSIFKALSGSELTKTLANIFTVSWGNRMELHAKRFIPVVKEAGGTFSEGFDHLIASKIFRDGKVTHLYDTNSNDLKKLEDALIKSWKELDLEEDIPVKTLERIEKDQRRLEREK